MCVPIIFFPSSQLYDRLPQPNHHQQSPDTSSKHSLLHMKMNEQGPACALTTSAGVLSYFQLAGPGNWTPGTFTRPIPLRCPQAGEGILGCTAHICGHINGAWIWDCIFQMFITMSPSDTVTLSARGVRNISKREETRAPGESFSNRCHRLIN